MTFSRGVARLFAIVTAVCATATMAPDAKAQFWGFGGDAGVYDSDVVSFPKTYAPGEIIVSFGDRRLYFITERGRALSYPIAVPKPEARWSGVQRVSRKEVAPTWTPTPQMRAENPKLPATVPGGHPQNPLGSRALYLGSTLYRIHGTDAPWTIGQNVSRGCVRMHNEHVEDLYKRVSIGTRVTATWKRFSGGSSGLTASVSTGGSSGSGGPDWAKKFLQP